MESRPNVFQRFANAIQIIFKFVALIQILGEALNKAPEQKDPRSKPYQTPSNKFRSR